jgi:hypothetical protein
MTRIVFLDIPEIPAGGLLAVHSMRKKWRNQDEAGAFPGAV